MIFHMTVWPLNGKQKKDTNYSFVCWFLFFRSLVCLYKILVSRETKILDYIKSKCLFSFFSFFLCLSLSLSLPPDHFVYVFFLSIKKITIKILIFLFLLRFFVFSHYVLYIFLYIFNALCSFFCLFRQIQKDPHLYFNNFVSVFVFLIFLLWFCCCYFRLF